MLIRISDEEVMWNNLLLLVQCRRVLSDAGYDVKIQHDNDFDVFVTTENECLVTWLALKYPSLTVRIVEDAD